MFVKIEKRLLCAHFSFVGLIECYDVSLVCVMILRVKV